MFLVTDFTAGWRLAIEAMDWETFEALVHAVVFEKDPRAERMGRPDGGADTLLPARGRTRAIVYQAKHYPGRIDWRHCRQSLGDAVASYRPGQVIFVLPQDFSAQKRKTFEEMSALAPGVEVTTLGMSQLLALLHAHPTVARRFLGSVALDIDDRVRRSLALGGQRLEHGKDLQARATELARFLNEWDPHFAYLQHSGPLDAPEPRLT